MKLQPGQLYELKHPKFHSFELTDGESSIIFTNVCFLKENPSTLDTFLILTDPSIRTMIFEFIKSETTEYMSLRPVNFQYFYMFNGTPDLKKTQIYRINISDCSTFKPFNKLNPPWETFWWRITDIERLLKPYTLMQPGNEEQDIDLITDRF